MFDIGLPEIAVILVVAVLVFGPERLPDFARQLGRLVRTVRQMADNAKADLQREMGTDFDEIRDELRGLDPRQAFRESIDSDPPVPQTPAPGRQRPLEPGEPAPYDVDAT